METTSEISLIPSVVHVTLEYSILSSSYHASIGGMHKVDLCELPILASVFLCGLVFRGMREVSTLEYDEFSQAEVLTYEFMPLPAYH